MKTKPDHISIKKHITFKFKKVALCSLFMGSLISKPAFSFSPADEWPVFSTYYSEEEEEPYYSPRVDTAGYNFVVGSGTTGLVDALFPITQNPSNLFYSNVRFTSQFLSPYDASVGLGYRHLSHSQQSMIGFYLFYDLRGSEQRNLYNQITAGGEYWYKKFYSGFTAYLPVSQTEKLFATPQRPYLVNIDENRRNIFMESQGFEKAMTGFDVELGYEPIPGLIAFGGGYAFFAKGFGNIAGPRGRIQYDLRTLLGDIDEIGHLSVDRLALESEVRHDSLRGTQVFAGLRIRLRYGTQGEKKIQRYSDLVAKMTSLARHDINLAPFITRLEYFNPVLNDRGNHLLIGDVSNETQLKEVLDPNEDVDVIAAHGEFAVKESVNLIDDQVLTGGNFKFIHNDQVYTVKLSDGAILNTADGIGLAANNLVRDITINSAGPWALQSAYNTIGQTTISNVTTNAGMQFISAEKNYASLVIDNSNFNLQGENLTAIDVNGEDVDFTLNNTRIHAVGNDLTGIAADGQVNLIASDVLVTAERGNATGIKADSVNIENNTTVQAIGKTAVGIEANMESIKAGNQIIAIGDDAIALKGNLISNDNRIIATTRREYLYPEAIMIAIGNNSATGVYGEVESNLGQIYGIGESSIGANFVVKNEISGHISGAEDGLGAGVVNVNTGIIYAVNSGTGADLVESNIGEIFALSEGIGVNEVYRNSGTIKSFSANDGGNAGLGASTVTMNESDGIVIGIGEGNVGAGYIEFNDGNVSGVRGGTGAGTIWVNGSDGKINGDDEGSIGAENVAGNLGEIQGSNGGTGVGTLVTNQGLIIGETDGTGVGSIENVNIGTIEGKDGGTGAILVKNNSNTIIGDSGGTGAEEVTSNQGLVQGSNGGTGANTVVSNENGQIIGDGEGSIGAVTVENNDEGKITSINGGKGADNLNDMP